MIFSESMQLHRERCGLTQDELARRLGVRQQTVSRWESSLAIPPPKRVVALEDEFGLERGTLLRTIGYLPDDERSGDLGDVPDLLAQLPRLNDTELMLVIDAAWQIFRDRRGITIDGVASASPADTAEAH